MDITGVSTNDFIEWVNMGLSLWPSHTKEEISEEFKQLLISNTQIVYLAKENNEPVGFITASIKHEHVPGAASNPIGYLEGLFIKEEYRHKGIAKALVNKAEAWAKSHGCKEMGSDTWDWNKESQEFHNKLGYQVHNILVHFIKKI